MITKSEDILKEHNQIYPLFLQVNFPQLHADYPEQVPEEYRERAKGIPFEARRIYAGNVMNVLY